MLRDVQVALISALRGPDPTAELERLVAMAELTPEERMLLARISSDGLELSRRVMRKVRLQRLFADPWARALMEEDPARFSEVFQRYDAEVASTSLFAEAESAAFRAFVARHPA